MRYYYKVGRGYVDDNRDTMRGIVILKTIGKVCLKKCTAMAATVAAVPTALLFTTCWFSCSWSCVFGGLLFYYISMKLMFKLNVVRNFHIEVCH